MRVGKTHEEFLEQIQLSLAEGSGPRAEIAKTVREESWAAKVAEMSDVIEPLISRRRLEIPTNECDTLARRAKATNH